MATKIRLRRGSANEWLEANPVLDIAEAGYETDTGRMKIGNGLDLWSELYYFNPALDDEFNGLLEVEEVADNMNMLLYVPLMGGGTYNKMNRYNFLKGDSIKVIGSIDDAKAFENGYENQLIFIPELNTIYVYFIVEGDIELPADDIYVLTTGDSNDDARWIAIAGQYMIHSLNVKEGGILKIGGHQVVKGREPDIVNLGIGALLEDHRFKINEILQLLRTHGLIGNI